MSIKEEAVYEIKNFKLDQYHLSLNEALFIIQTDISEHALI
jgi:hypothetical protein